MKSSSLLEKKIYSMTPIPLEEWRRFAQMLQIRHFKAGEIYPRHIVGHITEGLFRAFYREEDGRELTREFAREDDFLCYLTLYQTCESDDLIIVALEDSYVSTITQVQLEELYASHVCWAEFGRKLTEEALSKKMRRERQLLSSSLPLRYQQFRQDYCGLEQRLPQHLVASFLGVNPVSLSRIRKLQSAHP